MALRAEEAVEVVVTAVVTAVEEVTAGLGKRREQKRRSSRAAMASAAEGLGWADAVTAGAMLMVEGRQASRCWSLRRIAPGCPRRSPCQSRG